MQQVGKNLVLAAALAVLGVGATYAPPSQARVAVTIYAPSAPPPVRVERVPPPRAGYIWAAGYWNWTRGRYVWERGHWMRARHGYHYVAPRWVGAGHRWRYEPGRWGH